MRVGEGGKHEAFTIYGVECCDLVGQSGVVDVHGEVRSRVVPAETVF